MQKTPNIERSQPLKEKKNKKAVIWIKSLGFLLSKKLNNQVSYCHRNCLARVAQWWLCLTHDLVVVSLIPG